MTKKIIFWGGMISLIGLAGWVFSVILTVLTGGKFNAVANIFGYVGFLSFPISLVLGLIVKIFYRK